MALIGPSFIYGQCWFGRVGLIWIGWFRISVFGPLWLAGVVQLAAAQISPRLGGYASLLQNFEYSNATGEVGTGTGCLRLARVGDKRSVNKPNENINYVGVIGAHH